MNEPKEYIHNLSKIQWLIYTEFMKINDEDMQNAVKKGHGQAIRKLVEFIERIHNQIFQIVEKNVPKVNGVRVPVLASTRTFRFFYNTTLIFVHMNR